ISLRTCEIKSTRAIRYLGVIDNRPSCREHLEITAKKAADTGRPLNRIMLNHRGSKQGRRLLLKGAKNASML
ncbi:hypothetical protein KR009_006123, partial [Drosophila setifemur]